MLNHFSRLTIEWFDLGYLWQTLLWIVKIQLHIYSGNGKIVLHGWCCLVWSLSLNFLCIIFRCMAWPIDCFSIGVSQFAIQFWAHLGEYAGENTHGRLNSFPQFVQYSWVSATICYSTCPVCIDIDCWPPSSCLIGSLFLHFSICWHSFGLTQILDITDWINWSMINI